MSPGISLIVPCYNHAVTLVRAVASGLRQSFLQEIVVVDDGSTDDSAAVARELGCGDPRIRLIATPHNLGPGSARNVGVAAARGDYICFLDADDELIGDYFHDAFDLLAKQAGVMIVKSDMEYYDSIKGYILPTTDPRYKSVVLSSSCGMVMARDAYLRMGGYAEDAVFRGPFGGEDVAFMQAVMAHFGPIYRIERPCYRVWSQHGSHVDKFLANTRLKGDSFEFVTLHPDQMPGGPLERAVEDYLADVARRLGSASEHARTIN